MAHEGEYLTREKFEELTKELQHLKTEKRKEVAENLEYAKGLGDITENAEYHEAREMQATVEDRIATLENILKTANILSDKHGGVVNVGSTVIVQRAGGDKQTFTLVGSEEVDVGNGKISIHSPLDAALVGKRKGDRAQFKSPRGLTEYSVLEVK